jgi:hypothetical protein
MAEAEAETDPLSQHGPERALESSEIDKRQRCQRGTTLETLQSAEALLRGRGCEVESEEQDKRSRHGSARFGVP